MFRLLLRSFGGISQYPAANNVSFPTTAEAAGELRPASGPEQQAYHANPAIYDSQKASFSSEWQGNLFALLPVA
jgi:hypothetical protein